MHEGTRRLVARPADAVSARPGLRRVPLRRPAGGVSRSSTSTRRRHEARSRVLLAPEPPGAGARQQRRARVGVRPAGTPPRCHMRPRPDPDHHRGGRHLHASTRTCWRPRSRGRNGAGRDRTMKRRRLPRRWPPPRPALPPGAPRLRWLGRRARRRHGRAAVRPLPRPAPARVRSSTPTQVNRRFLLGQDPDRLLHTFRLTAGLPSAAEPLGGWEAPDNELRGHYTGHYLSACALHGGASRATRRSRRAATGWSTELARCQQRRTAT